MSKEEHLRYHARMAEKTILRPEVRQKVKELHATSAFREKIRQTMTTPEMKKLLSHRAKKQWENAAYKEFMAQKFCEFYATSEKYRKENGARLLKIQREYWRKEENRKEQSERTSRFFAAHPERKAVLSRLARAQWNDQRLLAWRGEQTKIQWTPEFRERRRRAYGQTYLRKALEIMKTVHAQCGAVDEGRYNDIRRARNDRSIIRLSTICSRFFNGDLAKLTEAVKNHNHRVKAVIPLKETRDVYDLEVPVTHNFALASGVFVHNSAKGARDRKFQAILPLRGKILNVEKARLDKALTFAEIKALIIALGAAIGDEFDAARLRYHRIIIATDADVDGAHIRTLLLTLFFRYFPAVIEAGYLYIAQPPLYRLQKGKNIRYAYTDPEKEKAIAELQKVKQEAESRKQKAAEEIEEMPAAENEIVGEAARIKGIAIQRYKGLGEMNPEQLWETTMDPARRVMKQVAIEDAAEADRIFDILMGDEVLPRKKFIQTHAKAVRNLDI